MISEDLNLTSISEGEKIILAGHEYKMVGGKFVLKR